MIKNIVFDFGGVFAKIDIVRSMDAFKALGLEDVEKYMDPYTQGGFFGEMEEGHIDGEEFRQKVSELSGHEVSWEDCDRAWHAIIVSVVKGNLQKVLDLREKGYRVALLSNTNPYMAGWFRSDKLDGEGHGISYYIPKEHQYLSYELKTMKPGKEIFQKMLDGEGFIPEETLFIDDGAGNIKTAQSLGLKTYLPDNGEDWSDKIETVIKNA